MCTVSCRLWLTITGIFVIACAANLATANDNISDELSEAANYIDKKLRQEGENTIIVGEFPSSGAVKANSGPLISTTLSDLLNRRGIKPDRKARFEVSGKYLALHDPGTKLPYIKMFFEIIDLHNGAVVFDKFDRSVFGLNHVAVMTGATVDFQYDEKPNDQHLGAQLEQRIDYPTAYVFGGAVASSEDSPFALEIWVKSGEEYEKRPAVKHTRSPLKKGFAFVGIKNDEVYAVRLINRANFQAGVKLTIDGLSMFHFSDNESRDNSGRPLSTHVLIDPHHEVFIKGWFKNNRTVSQFHIKQYAENELPQFRIKSDIGTISASFCAVWKDNATRPKDEPLNPSEFMTAREYTEQGTDVAADFVRMKRKFGVVRSVVTIRYSEKNQ